MLVSPSAPAKTLDVSVVVVTLARPECLAICLDRLEAQRPYPREIIVVDASSDMRSLVVARSFPRVTYVRHAGGAGHMTASRNLGLVHTTAPVIAFIDDDAYAHDGWLNAIASTFAEGVGAVGGRAVQGFEGEDSSGVDRIGRLTDRGTLLGYFAADPGRSIDVDHVQGCNMAFAREVLQELGGFRDDYPGTALREESDMCLRVARMGRRIVFNPKAVVTHAGAAQAVGDRFDLRYEFYAHRNHCQLLVRNFGLGDPIFWRFLWTSRRESVEAFLRRLRGKQFPSAFARLLATLAGTIAGTAAGVRIVVRDGVSPVRDDAVGREISASLMAHAGSNR